MNSTVAARGLPEVTRRRNRFFVWVAIAMLVIIALGFGKSFYLRPWFSERPLPPYLVLHGVLMSAWYLLFLVQVGLVNTDRREMHRKLGIAGVVLAALAVAAGIYVDLNIIPHRLALGIDLSTPEALNETARFALASMSSVVVFGLVVAVAVAFRRNVAMHRRLMFWAFVWSLGPALTSTRPLGAVLDPLVAPYLPFFPMDFIWLGLLMTYDWKTERRIHPATYLGFISLTILFFAGEFWFAHIDALQDWIKRPVLLSGVE